jgi:hypothetical protein
VQRDRPHDSERTETGDTSGDCEDMKLAETVRGIRRIIQDRETELCALRDALRRLEGEPDAPPLVIDDVARERARKALARHGIKTT